MNFLKYFDDHNLCPREEQEQVLTKLQDNWNDYNFFIVSAPPGVGKTYINLSIAEFTKNSYILTSTKMLQEQYMDCSASIVNLKGRSNYTCNYDTNFKVDAAPCLIDKGLKGRCLSAKSCDYYAKKAEALESQTMITNYMYFLFAANLNKEEDNPWKQRSVIIMDEAHELEQQLINFAEVIIDINELHIKYGVKTKNWTFSGDKDFDLDLIESVIEAIEERAEYAKEKLETLFKTTGSEGLDELKKSTGNIQKWNNISGDLSRILKTMYLWQSNRSLGRWIESIDTKENTMTISPLFASDLFNEYMKDLGKKFVFTSATMGNPDTFCKEMGIPPDKVLYIEVGTPFPAEKSPIITIPIAKMGYKDLDKNMSTIINAIDTIMDGHEGEKGIIHSGNYKIASAIHSIPKGNRKRLISRDMSSAKLHNMDLMKLHENAEYDSVLLSPSMTTGIDLYDELSRFQIIVKLPFLSLGDPRVKKKSNMDSAWYRDKMWIQILQSSCRSTRSVEDYSTTYILDGSFAWWFKNDKKGLPIWFKDRLE